MSDQNIIDYFSMHTPVHEDLAKQIDFTGKEVQELYEYARALQSSLRQLVGLKLYKDEYGKTEVYTKLQPAAWQLARLTLK